MQYPILRSLVGNDGLNQLMSSWPLSCLDAHGPIERLPEPLRADILSSIPALTNAYQGHLNELDLRKGYEMYPVPDGTADKVVDKGATAYLEDISPLLDGAEEFVKNLELDLGIGEGSAKLGAFLSASGNGAPTHYDVLDVISIQLVGTKLFNVSPVKQIRFPYGTQYCEATPVFDDLYPQISRGFPNCKDQSFVQIKMEPGSVLFLPRGTWHHTKAESDSLAISIVLSPPTQIDFFLDQLKSTLLQDAEWRSPCYDLGNMKGINTKLYSKLSSIIYRMAKSHQNPQSAIRSFQKNSRYLRNPDVTVQTVPGSEGHTITYSALNMAGEFGTARMEVSPAIAEVFQWLETMEQPFTVSECMNRFPDILPNVIAELFYKAEESGLLRKLWFDPLK